MSPSEFIEILIKGTGAEKRKAVIWLDDAASPESRTELRVLLMHHLQVTHAPPQNSEDESIHRQDARAWMLSALGRVSKEDAAARDLLEQHLKAEYESNEWNRYWALEGIIATGGDSAVVFATMAKSDTSALVRCLALAVLATNGDQGALQVLRAELGQNLWATLRALRICMVPDPTILKTIFEIVRTGEYSDATYDAIVALGRVSRGSPEAIEAVEVLAGYVRRYRWPMYDSMRTNALISIGRLRSPHAVPVLLEELTDENPMIVLQAARALEAAVGARTSCRRILESVTQGIQKPELYASALRALTREQVVSELEAALTTGATKEKEAALVLLRELGGAEAMDRLAAIRRTAEGFVAAQSAADQSIRNSLESSLAEVRQGFKVLIGMDIAIFVAGFLILCLGIGLVISADDSLDRLVGALTSGTGFIGVLIRVMTRARANIEPTVTRLVKVQAAFHGYLRQLRQVDQAYTQRVLEGKMQTGDVRDYTGMLEQATARTLEHLTDAGKRTPGERLAGEESLKSTESVLKADCQGAGQ